jgi:LmbE family N-acetylglucosaminyl deacetylase
MGSYQPMKDLVFLAPHLDDVALSCGGLAAQATAAGASGLCVTIFTAPPAPGAPVSDYARSLNVRWGSPDPIVIAGLRQAEERAAMRLLGLDLVLLPYSDAIYREGRYLSHAGIFGAVDPDEAPFAEELAATLERELQAHGVVADATIYAPLGLGGHVDHQITFAAARRLAAAGRRIRHYEDFPYAAKPEAHAVRFAALAAGGADFAPRAEYCDIGAGLPTKIAAVAAYPSQISSLFPSLEAMPDAVRDYAARVAAEWRADGAAVPPPTGGAQFAERYWRVD